jgi:hypothetical protein
MSDLKTKKIAQLRNIIARGLGADIRTEKSGAFYGHDPAG